MNLDGTVTTVTRGWVGPSVSVHLNCVAGLFVLGQESVPNLTLWTRISRSISFGIVSSVDKGRSSVLLRGGGGGGRPAREVWGPRRPTPHGHARAGGQR